MKDYSIIITDIYLLVYSIMVTYLIMIRMLCYTDTAINNHRYVTGTVYEMYGNIDGIVHNSVVKHHHTI